MFWKRLIILAALACIPFRGECKPPVADNTLVWGVCTRPMLINPILTTHTASSSLLDLVFNCLVRIDANGVVVGDLARSWEISGDGKLYTFHLRSGVKFHDGTEFTSRDALFTFESIISPEVRSPYAFSFRNVERFEAPGPYTFVVRLKDPEPFFLQLMVRHILPAHLYRGRDIAASAFNYHPVGTGPFIFREWSADNRLTLDANPAYYEGKPALGRVVVKVYGDTREVWAALMRSEVDFTGFISREDYEILKTDPAFKAYRVTADYYYALYFDVNDPVVRDLPVREAISCAINRKDLIDQAAGGYGEKCNSLFDANAPGDPSGSDAYLPERSRELLAQAGWQDVDGDGILDKEGVSLEFRVLVDTRQDSLKRMLMVIRQQLQQVGIKVRMVAYTDDTMLTPGFLADKRPQAMLKLFFCGFDAYQQERDWSSLEKTGADKVWVYHNRDINMLFREARLSSDNRPQILRKIDQIIRDERPACFLFHPCDFHVVSSKFANTEAFFNKNMPFYLLKDWRKR